MEGEELDRTESSPESSSESSSEHLQGPCGSVKPSTHQAGTAKAAEPAARVPLLLLEEGMRFQPNFNPEKPRWSQLSKGWGFCPLQEPGSPWGSAPCSVLGPAQEKDTSTQITPFGKKQHERRWQLLRGFSPPHFTFKHPRKMSLGLNTQDRAVGRVKGWKISICPCLGLLSCPTEPPQLLLPPQTLPAAQTGPDTSG